jgi:hypothetical protein
MLGGEPELLSAELSWFFWRYSNTRPQAASAKQRTFFAGGGSDLSSFYFSFAIRYSLSRLARIPRVDYKRKPT